FFQLPDLAPEQRLKLFDQLIDGLSATSAYRPSLRRNTLALLAGYLATVAAGGKPTLSLAESNAAQWPEVTGWAYVVGGIGERVFWTSSFDGLGRLVARELMRPLILDDPPTCDFAYDEAAILVDPKLPDPLVHLRIKQGKIATVALLPGVNISVGITNLAAQDARGEAARTGRQMESTVGSRANRDVVAAIADAIWPY